jgi:hypothetical protein
MPRAHLCILVSLFVATIACSDPNAIPLASIANDTSIVTLYSLRTGPLTQPNAYSLNAGKAGAGVQTWQVGTNFEFAFWMEASGKAEFLPLDVLGLSATGSVKPGLIKSAVSFDAMGKAPQNGYVTSDTVPIAEGDRFYVRSGVNTCVALGVPLYGKLEVLDIDTTAATVKLMVLADQNCGYRGLGLGIPKS